MVYDVELVHQPSGRYVARVVSWPSIVVEAESRDEVLNRVQAAIRAQRSAGVEIVRVVVDEENSPTGKTWRHHAGAFPDDELYQQMLDEIRRGRDEADSPD